MKSYTLTGPNAEAMAALIGLMCEYVATDVLTGFVAFIERGPRISTCECGGTHPVSANAIKKYAEVLAGMFSQGLKE